MARIILPLATALVAACGAEEVRLELDVESSAATVEPAPEQPDPEAIAAETWELYQELMQRLEERGVALEEFQAAADAEDEEAIREMLGWTPEEMAEADARALDLIERMRVADYPSSDAVPLEGWDCGWKGWDPWLQCLGNWGGGILGGPWQRVARCTGKD